MEFKDWNVWTEWSGGQNLRCAPLLSDISLPHQFQHLKSSSLPRRFLGKHQLSATREEGRKSEREEKGGGKLFLRHVSLICSPAANENNDLQKVFSFSWLCICPSKPHSWSHTLNKCNLYSIMNTTKKTDRTHGPGSRTDLTHKTAGFLPPMSLCGCPDQWPVEHVGSANFITCTWSWCDSLIVKNHKTL